MLPIPVSPIAPADALAPRPENGAAPEIDPAREAELRQAAMAFEAAFLAEMLKAAGAGRSAPDFDGGAGEAAFSGELINEQARLMAERGGDGLAERIFESMLAQEG